MSNASTLYDEKLQNIPEHPGMHLSALRQKKGYSVEYVAAALHLRSRVIELIELGEYHLLAGPVFVKGYLKAYAKLLGVPSDSYVQAYNELYPSEKKLERALWQAKKQSSKAERYIRWVTLTFAVSVAAAVVFWWQNSKIDEQALQTRVSQNSSNDLASQNDNADLKEVDLTAMNEILNPKNQMSPMEESGG
jgi:cytoskeleton protein RodZ